MVITRAAGPQSNNFGTMFFSMSLTGLVHPKGAQIYLFHEFEGIQGGPPGAYNIYMYVLIYVAPIKAWWMHIYIYTRWRAAPCKPSASWGAARLRLLAPWRLRRQTPRWLRFLIVYGVNVLLTLAILVWHIHLCIYTRGTVASAHTTLFFFPGGCAPRIPGRTGGTHFLVHFIIIF